MKKIKVILFAGLFALVSVSSLHAEVTPAEMCKQRCGLDKAQCTKKNPRGEARMKCVEKFSNCKVDCEQKK